MSLNGMHRLMPRPTTEHRPADQCCPNCGAPATRNILHCEYCQTPFDDTTKGIDIYALCDFDPETERMVNGKVRTYADL